MCPIVPVVVSLLLIPSVFTGHLYYKQSWMYPREACIFSRETTFVGQCAIECNVMPTCTGFVWKPRSLSCSVFNCHKTVATRIPTETYPDVVYSYHHCPSTYVLLGSYCHKLIKSLQNITEAARTCRNMGAVLSEGENIRQTKALQNWLKLISIDTDANYTSSELFGVQTGFQMAGNGTIIGKWKEGNELVIPNWLDGYPNVSDPNATFIMFETKNSKAVNIRGNVRRYFMCQVDVIEG